MKSRIWLYIVNKLVNPLFRRICINIWKYDADNINNGRFGLKYERTGAEKVHR